MKKAMVVFNSYETLKKQYGKRVFIVMSVEKNKGEYEYHSSEYGELRPYESRPKGKWEEATMNFANNKYINAVFGQGYHCSNCGMYMPNTKTNFCANCGARME